MALISIGEVKPAIIPLTARKEYGNTYKGQEYLGLCPYVVREHDMNGVDTLWVHSNEKTYYLGPIDPQD